LAAAAPIDRIPLYVREGAILPKIPDDVMTLVPQTEYKDQAVKSLDNRRVYEIYPGAQLRSITDFEGRTVAPGPQPASLVVTGAAGARHAAVALQRPRRRIRERSETEYRESRGWQRFRRLRSPGTSKLGWE